MGNERRYTDFNGSVIHPDCLYTNLTDQKCIAYALLDSLRSVRGFSTTAARYHDSQHSEVRLASLERAGVHEAIHSPAERLRMALANQNKAYNKGFHPQKVDLGRIHPLVWDRLERHPGVSLERVADPRNVARASMKLRFRQSERHKRRLADILAEYISTKYNKTGDTFLTEASVHLEQKGYDATNLVTWDWILSSQSSEEAALRLAFIKNTPINVDAQATYTVPVFVFLLLLQRGDMTARALALCINHAEHVLEKNSPSFARLGLDSITQIIFRLLRQSRRLWPAACTTITKLWIQYVSLHATNDEQEQGPMSVENSIRFSFLYNRMLSILALPPSMHPFQSLNHRQRAQFMVIRKMSEFSPPLVISREGYRAVSRVQLAHKKTLRERNWANLKRQSWPPWKEDKLGIDASISPEDGNSRATESLSRAREAGYGTLIWEDAAGILAGWDTDHTPTIQTRSLLGPKAVNERRSNLKIGPLENIVKGRRATATIIWAARIRATRTFKEAWMCFSEGRKSTSRVSSDVYVAMYEKLFYEQSRQRERGFSRFHLQDWEESTSPMPGDGRELAASSSAHNEDTYARIPPPTVSAMLRYMAEDKVVLKGSDLAPLLLQVQQYRDGARLLWQSNLSHRTLQVLLPQKGPDSSNADTLLKDLPNQLFAAYIDFLCRFGHLLAPPSSDSFERNSHKLKARRDLNGHIVSAEDLQKRYDPLFHAFRLVNIRQPPYRPPWNSLFRALSRQNTIIRAPGALVCMDGEGRELTLRVQALKKWNTACRLQDHMSAINLELDFEGFRLLCLILENATEAARKFYDASTTMELKQEAQAILKAGLVYLKMRFQTLVHPIATAIPAEADSILRGSPSLPRLVESPHPAHLHAYIRVLGLQGDFTGLLDLVRWMAENNSEINGVAQETMNGRKMLRRCLVAVRVFLESQGNANEMQDARNIIIGKFGWGGWPTSEEVDIYTHGQHIKD